MGAAEEQTPSKPSKGTSSAQEAQPPMPAYPDWSNSMQAYYGTSATPPFFASTVAAPTPHPYMWAGQRPMMPPYGTPVPYPALYPPGGVYTHPNMAMTPNPAGAAESEGKNSDVKDQNSVKKPKVNSGPGNEKAADTGKATSGSGNEGGSQSAESGSEGSSDASDDNNQQEPPATKKGSFDLMLEDGANAQNNSEKASVQGSMPGKSVVAATNLNIGMDLWNSSAAGGVKMRPSTGVAASVAPAIVGREGLMSDHQWIQDDRELKRQKRKQSNRESARRSRLRKQAECEELQRRVESLNNENSSLREELNRLSAECEKLISENNSIKEELTQICGPDSLQSLGENNASGEDNS